MTIQATYVRGVLVVVIKLINNEYDTYLAKHRRGVMDSFYMVRPQLRDYMLNNLCHNENEVEHRLSELWKQLNQHDDSKYSDVEYNAYNDYFYGKERTPEIELNFNMAWNHHQKCNPHHWQYWTLIKDSGKIMPLPMPFNYIVEMLCDWHSFSRKNLQSTAYKWYIENKNNMMLHKDTITVIETLIELFKEPLPLE